MKRSGESTYPKTLINWLLSSLLAYRRILASVCYSTLRFFFFELIFHASLRSSQSKHATVLREMVAAAEAKAAIGVATPTPTAAPCGSTTTPRDADVDDKMTIVGHPAASLPLETRWPPFPLRRLGGFWMPESLLPAVAALHTSFAPAPDGVLLASFPKSGTSWLKALAFAAANRAAHPPSDADHPLRRRNPHDCVEFFEMRPDEHTGATSDGIAVDAASPPPPPRVLATHLPYSLLPKRITAGDGCRIIYICRDPKDTLVSFWHFSKKMAATMAVDAGAFTFDEAFELFCDGNCTGGPQWRHVLEYWEASRRCPGKVLFLRYEDMLRRPASGLRKMAEFMGCPFAAAEEAAGVADAIVELCSLDELRSLEVNRNGTDVLGLKNESYFRKGVAGDWRNHMTPAMAARLDKIVDDATRGSGLSLANATPSPPMHENEIKGNLTIYHSYI